MGDNLFFGYCVLIIDHCYYMFSLENYFKNIIDGDSLDGSWMLLGQEEENKLKLVLNLALKISNQQGIFIISNPSYLEEDILEKIQNFDVNINSARQAIRFLNLTNFTKKILIINKAEELEFEAQNALLKVVEEPPLNSALFFLIKDESKILPTLRSRMKAINIPILDYKKHFKSLVSSNALDFLSSSNVDFSLIKKNFNKKSDESLHFLESLVILLRDRMLESQNLKDLKLSSVVGKFDLANLKLALKTLRQVESYNVNSRLQAENLVSKLF